MSLDQSTLAEGHEGESAETISECVRSSPWWGVVKSLGYYRRGPVGLLHTQKVQNSIRKAHFAMHGKKSIFPFPPNGVTASRRSEKPPLIVGEMPANSGPLRIDYQSPGSVFVYFHGENAKSLRPHA